MRPSHAGVLAGVVAFIGVGAPEPALLGALAGPVFYAARAVSQKAANDVGLVFEPTPQGGRLSSDRFAPSFEADSALLEILGPFGPRRNAP